MPDSKTRVFIDTNVLVSAEIAGGRPGRVVELGLTGEITLCLSDTVLNEYVCVMTEQLGWAEQAVRARLELLARNAEIIEAENVVTLVKGEEADNRILAAALAGEVDYLVTGDHKHLVPLGAIEGIPIVTPEVFLKRLVS